jgi:hypothetical protein
VAALFAGGAPGPDAIGAFLAANDVPLTEPGAATFAFRGEAESVELVRFIGDAHRTALERVPATDLWLPALAVADGGRFEYKLAVRRDGWEEWVLDPLNPAAPATRSARTPLSRPRLRAA